MNFESVRGARGGGGIHDDGWFNHGSSMECIMIWTQHRSYPVKLDLDPHNKDMDIRFTHKQMVAMKFEL